MRLCDVVRIFWRVMTSLLRVLVADFFAGCFFAADFAAAVVFFAGVRDAVFFERADAIGSLHLDYQMRVKARVELFVYALRRLPVARDADFSVSRRLLRARGDGDGFLLAGGLLRALCGGGLGGGRGFRAGGDALAQRVHEVDDLAARRSDLFVLGDGQVLELGFDELFDGDLVAVDELLRIELAGARLMSSLARSSESLSTDMCLMSAKYSAGLRSSSG